ncbi:MAG: hypothetical protein SPL71_00985 [Oribacterium sp.]|nr:hypothetical protein [Oribacterium sp.]
MAAGRYGRGVIHEWVLDNFLCQVELWAKQNGLIFLQDFLVHQWYDDVIEGKIDDVSWYGFSLKGGENQYVRVNDKVIFHRHLTFWFVLQIARQ